jgi:zinc D-Ala-D-Ala dipeptidase
MRRGLALTRFEKVKEVKMPSGYDEMTDHAFADYSGGTPQERARRALLRQAMEKRDFQVPPKSGGTSTTRIGNSTQSSI